MPALRAFELDRWFLGWSAASSVVALLAFGLVAAIIPNPVFGRQVPPEPFAIAIWIVSAPLMGIVAATYAAPPRSPAPAVAQPLAPAAVRDGSSGTTLGTLGSVGAFLAIGCPVCNKVALLLLGASGAMTIYAPLQPVIGVASLALLASTAGWRLRRRTRGGTCPA